MKFTVNFNSGFACSCKLCIHHKQKTFADEKKNERNNETKQRPQMYKRSGGLFFFLFCSFSFVVLLLFQLAESNVAETHSFIHTQSKSYKDSKRSAIILYPMESDCIAERGEKVEKKRTE